MYDDGVEKLRSLSRKLVRELGMLQLDQDDSSETPAHWHALVEIDKDPNLTISKLGSLLLMSTSKISRLANSLRKKGLINFKGGADKREKYLLMTVAGKTAVQRINQFSENKIKGAFKFLNKSERSAILNAIDIYARALEKNRLLDSELKIATLPTSRIIRKQIVAMISDIQLNEFSIPITKETNLCLLKAEHTFYYNKSYNFWYAMDGKGQIVGSIGLNKLNAKYGEIKKFFVAKEYRGTGVAKKLMQTLVQAAQRHGFTKLFLGSADVLKVAHSFYEKYGFKKIDRAHLPAEFDLCTLDSVFYEGDVALLWKS